MAKDTDKAARAIFSRSGTLLSLSFLISWSLLCPKSNADCLDFEVFERVIPPNQTEMHSSIKEDSLGGGDQKDSVRKTAKESKKKIQKGQKNIEVGVRPIAGREETFKQRVSIEADRFFVERRDKRLYFDFKDKTISTLNLKDGTYWTNSLFANVSFRVNELHNRLAIRKVLQAANLGDGKIDDFCDLVNLASLFGLQTEGDANSISKIAESISEAGLSFNYKDKELTRFRPSSESVPAELKATLSRFLMYEMPMHPSIRKKLEAAGKYPQEIFIQIDNSPAGTHSLLYKLSNFSKSAGDQELKTYKKVNRPDSPLKDIYVKIESLGGKPQNCSINDVTDFCQKSMQEGNYLDTLLAITEFELQTGTKIRGLLERRQEDFNNDPGVKTFVLGLSPPQNNDQAQKYFAALSSIDRSKLKKGYMIDVFRANLLSYIQVQMPAKSKDGDAEQTTEEPVQLFLSVLKENPFITGAYKDLGRLFYNDYDMVSAWECWDLARRYYPEHPMLRDIAKLEGNLETEAAEFFEGDTKDSSDESLQATEKNTKL